jgi:orotate phosphoribosyltransferase
LGMAAIFTYGFPVATENFRDANVSLICLSDYAALIEEAQRMNYVQADQLASLSAWREDPASWGRP